MKAITKLNHAKEWAQKARDWHTKHHGSELSMAFYVLIAVEQIIAYLLLKEAEKK